MNLNLLLFAYSNAEIIKKVEISGNKRISNETILDIGSLVLDQDYYDFILKLETAMQEISSGMRPQIVLSNLTINSGSNE